MSAHFENEISEISSFTQRDERWFAAATQPPRRIDSRPPIKRVPALGDPIADRWFR